MGIDIITNNPDYSATLFREVKGMTDRDAPLPGRDVSFTGEQYKTFVDQAVEPAIRGRSGKRLDAAASSDGHGHHGEERGIDPIAATADRVEQVVDPETMIQRPIE